MKARCFNARELGVSILHDFKWVISVRGYANVKQSKSDYVLGVVYEIDSDDEAELDLCEGVGIGCYDKHYLPVLLKNTQETSLVYIDPRQETGVAWDAYKETLRYAINDWKLSQVYVNKYMRAFL